MPAPAHARVDVAIFGGGIAGLWTLARLRGLGYSAVLLEADRIGAGQSIASQGIIHGGLKYAADFKLGAAARALGDMPALWRQCLAGTGEIDLRRVRVLAEHHLMWLPPGLMNAATGFFAAQAIRSRTERLAPADWPAVLQGEPTVGAVYRLDEPVLDVPSLLQALALPLAGHIRRIDWPAGVAFEPAEGARAIMRLRAPDGAAIRLEARFCLFAAGAGNEALLARLPAPPGRGQRRPLHMLLAKGMPQPLYAHCFEASDKPRVTVTSHPGRDGGYVWYLGGQIAESGIARDRAAQIEAGRRELAALLPRLDLTQVRWSSLAIDRAEAHHLGRRPDHPVLQSAGPILVAWPTKLAFAPRLAAEVVQALERAGAGPSGDGGDMAALAALPEPDIALPPWEEAAAWS